MVTLLAVGAGIGLTVTVTGTKAETQGAEIKIGGNDLYKSVCRKHFRKLTKLV